MIFRVFDPRIEPASVHTEWANLFHITMFRNSTDASFHADLARWQGLQIVPRRGGVITSTAARSRRAGEADNME